MKNKSEDTWYLINDVYDLDTPVLVIYPERVKENIRIMKDMIEDVRRLRPHVKTSKSKEAVLLLRNEGIEKFKCATIAEAETVALAGGKDILLAYQPIGPKLERFSRLISKYRNSTFSCLFDNKETVKKMSAIASSNNLVINVYLDLNVGMNRTGISPGKDALELYIMASGLPGIKVWGIHAYDGHIRNPDLEKRTIECTDAFRSVEELAEGVRKQGLSNPVIVAGGTPTYPIHAKRSEVECSPGTFIYWDKGYRDTLPEQQFVPAALVVCRVISIPAPNKICLDLGHKSIASENDLTKRVEFLNTSDLKFIGQSEEHLIVEVQDNHHYQVGDVFYGIPFHICPTCALYERAYTVENNKLIGEWKTVGRDRKIEI